MSFSFASMVRLLVLLAIGSTLLAIGVSRLDPPQLARRYQRPVSAHNVNDFFLHAESRKSRWIDSTSGELIEMPVVGDDVLEAASCSPWVNESGRRQVVGRWANRTLEGPQTVSHAFGLARYSFPDGQVLNQIQSNMIPIAPPCWLPGTRARILFVAGDGRLYRFAFEPDGPISAAIESGQPADLEPLALTWRCPKPGDGEVFLNDLSWPEDPRLGGRLVVSMRVGERDESGSLRFSRMQLWWLKLNHSATEVIEVGPLLQHDQSSGLARQSDERSPTVASLPDGSLALAFSRLGTESKRGWTVYLAPLALDADHRPVPVFESSARAVLAGCLPAPLAFSPDGQWINALVSETAPAASVQRVRTLAPTRPNASVLARSE